MTDADYVEMATHLNQSLEDVDGGGFTETPLLFSEELNCFLKNETDNVGQSHKARHLNNVMLYLLALRATGMDELADRRLAVASCGNAGLAAATSRRRQAGRSMSAFLRPLPRPCRHGWSTGVGSGVRTWRAVDLYSAASQQTARRTLLLRSAEHSLQTTAPSPSLCRARSAALLSKEDKPWGSRSRSNSADRIRLSTLSEACSYKLAGVRLALGCPRPSGEPRKPG